MTDQTRKAFEAWSTTNMGGGLLGRNASGGYVWPDTSLAWQAWQAAAEAEQERCALLCELIKEAALSTQAGPADDLSNVMVRQVAHLGAGACADLIRQGGEA